MANLCLVQLSLAAAYIVCFLTALIYLLLVNRCKFNTRTKVVLILLALSMSLQTSSAVLSYTESLNQGACRVYPLAYAMLGQERVLIMIIYSLLVCRMLSIYFKMRMAVQTTPSWKARWARRISKCQNTIASIYALLFTATLWIYYYLFEWVEPEKGLTGR